MSVPIEKETELIEQSFAFLSEMRQESSKCMKIIFDRLSDLKALINSFSEFDVSCKEWDETWAMYNATSSRLYTEPRVAITHAFFQTKLDAFLFLSERLKECGSGFQNPFQSPLWECMFVPVCVLMTEEVYISALNNPTIPIEMREFIKRDLNVLWNNAINEPSNSRFFPRLEQLWIARSKSQPVYGTMSGMAEFINLAINLPGTSVDSTDWTNFCKEQDKEVEDTHNALQEFLFGLSYEDIFKMNNRLKDSGAHAVDKDNIHTMFGAAQKMTYIPLTRDDPRTFYKFFTDRRERALNRKLISCPGPTQTIEELYLEYLVSKDEEYREYRDSKRRILLGNITPTV